MLRTFKELIVWQESYALCGSIYTLTEQFPSDERFGLTSQLRRARVSIPSNIAEGYNRDTTPDYVRFLFIALGSLGEVETHMMLSRDVRLCEPRQCDEVLDLIAEINRMLRALIRSLKQKQQAHDGAAAERRRTLRSAPKPSTP